jgi:transcriptional regulator with XRE-family HTH domain
MTPPGQWIRAARGELGLSTRELAALAGVAYPTISRIEKGHTQPRWDTLATIAGALGFTCELDGLHPRPMVRLADLVDAWQRGAGGSPEPDWTQLRAFADQLRRHPELSGAAIAGAPRASGSALIDNLLAAIAERVADELGLRRPRWTRLVEPLAEPWEAPGTPRMRAANAAYTAPQFAARGLIIPEASIWRDRSPALT